MYTRPNKPLYIDEKRRDLFVPYVENAPVHSPQEVSASTECHVTPPEVATRMIEYLDPDPLHMVLEPSAGTGNLVDALIDSGHDPERIIAIERDYNLHNSLTNKFQLHQCLHNCFLEYCATNSTNKSISAILMNPPFRQIKKHMNAAIQLLDRNQSTNSRLIAIVPVTYRHERAETLESLPNDIFIAARVNTKIILIDSKTT